MYSIYSTIAPVGQPSSVIASNVSATNIKLHWSPPFNPYDEILDYGIIYQLIDTSFSIETPRPPVTVASQSTIAQYTIGSLLANTVYRIVVFAILEEGTGPLSEEITVSTMAAGNYNECEMLLSHFL